MLKFVSDSMRENKYFYNNIPLSKYCKDNDINVSTIHTRIWKMKQDKKYENYTKQEIVNIVIEAYGSGIKYMYKGISLRQYCIENDIKFGTINNRIISLKKQYSNLSNDEIVALAMENFNNRNFRFFYQGMSLKEYCNEHPEIKYNTIRTFINKEIEKNPNISIEEAIEMYISKKHKGIYRYYYCGIPLVQYCEENDISYKNIISYMSKYRNNSEFQNLTDDEFVEQIMDKYQPFEPKYIYNGITLRQYCEQNNLSYYSVVSFVKRRLAKNNSLNIDDLIDEGINIINRYGIIYYYNGIPLKDYAKENDLNASSIRSAILRHKIKTSRPLQEIINQCVESYKKFTIKYYYGNETLASYCNKIGLNYNTVIQIYLDKYSDNPNITIDEAIKEIVEKSIKKHEKISKIKKINEIFKQLKYTKTFSIDKIKEICEFLKIDYDNVEDLVNMDFSYNQSINIIWYFSDVINNQGYKLITVKKLKELFVLIEQIKKSNVKNLKNFKLYDLIGIYKSKLYDSRNEIFLRQKKYIHKVINSLCPYYGIKVDRNNLDDLESELKMYLIISIDRNNVNVPGQIVKYMDLVVKGNFRGYLKKQKQEDKLLSLDDKKYGDNESPRVIEFVADPKDQYVELEDTPFSSNMMKALSNLSQQDILFVMLKFQENYSNNELAQYFNMSIEEVKSKEISILSTLKNNDNIKVMKKIKK